jgi:pimeloyl-ACP methyl ester carboxylesterase
MSKGISIYYRDNKRRNSPVLLMLHSLGENGHIFDALLDAGLTERFRTIVPDLRGRGKSARPETGYSLDEHCKDLAGMLEHLGIDHVCIAGHSFGGLLGLYFTAHYPGMVKGLTIIDSAPELHPMSPIFLMIMLDRLGKVYPSEESYLLSVRATPFMTQWDERMRALYLADVAQSGDGPLTVLTQKRHVLQAGSDILRIDSRTWRKYALGFRGNALLLSAAEPFVMGQHMVPVQKMKELAVLFPKGYHAMVTGNHMTMLYGKGAMETAAAILLHMENGVSAV